MSNYVTYHLHSDYSLLDSTTDYHQYIDYAKEIGQTAICFTEHGKMSGWVGKKMYCDSVGIKFLVGIECYLTETLEEKVRDNYHTILIAKNKNGLKELLSLMSLSSMPDHKHYVNRISFDEFLNISDDIIKISACIASPLCKLPISHEKYKLLISNYDYLEIQHHNCQEQKDYNVFLASMASKYNKPLIAGTDTHSLNKYKAECRDILLKSKGRIYDDEDKLDMTYKTYDELVSAYKEQDALPEAIYMQAIENTNVMAESVEDFQLDYSLKYPILYGTRERDEQVFHETIERKFASKIESGEIKPEQVDAFREAIKEEKRVFTKIEMNGFMLSMSELVSWCHDNGIPTGYNRGSVGGSRIAYITDIIGMNPETWHTVFSRFANEDRKEVGDIDIDVIESDRPKIFDYIIGRFGKDKTARVESFGRILGNGTIREITRAFRTQWENQNPDAPKDDCPYSLAVTAQICDLFNSDEEKARKRFPEIFYYFDGLTGTRISQSVHPAGIVISPITLADNYGVFDKNGDICLCLDMDEVHEVGLVKYDFLILKNIEIIKNTFNYIGKEYPKTIDIDWSDQAVWADMLRSPVGIFQMESEFAFSMLKLYKPKSIFDMSLVTAAIRPSGSSYRNDLMAHKPYKNPSKMIDDLLAENNGYLIYQEDTIKFLQQICGLSGSDADNVRRAIGRKDEERLNKALPQILEGYCSKSSQPREVAEKEASQFLQIIKDSASYQFG